MPLQKHPKYKWAIAFSDYFAVIASLAISIFFLDSLNVYPFVIEQESKLRIFICYLLLSGLQIIFFQLLGLYHIQTISNKKLSFLLLSEGCSLSIPLFFITIAVLNIHLPPVQFFFVLFIISVTLLLLMRKLCLLVIQHTNLISDRVVIIGAGAKGQSMLNSLSNGLKVKKTVGFIDDKITQGRSVMNIPVLGKIYESHLIARRNKVDFFIMAIDNISREHFFEILRYFNENNLTIYITSNYLGVLQKNLRTDKFNRYGLIRIGHPVQSALLRFSKRVFDIVASIIGLILISPLLIVIAVAIKLTSRGPIIYNQVRIGKGGKPFIFYKFRSMRVNSDVDAVRNEQMVNFIRGNNPASSDGNKIVNHSRITKIGRNIRKTSLDELPQLINVLKGDMSLVGPRPCLPVEWNVYGSWQKQRLMYMPGCTGFWQVGGRSKVNFEESVIMDLYYNCNVSLWLDLKIILKTIPVMIFSKGGE